MKQNCILFISFFLLVACAPRLGNQNQIEGSSTTDLNGGSITAQPTTASVPTASVPISAAVITETPDPLVISPENVAELVELARWGDGWIQDIAWSSDNQLVAVATSTGVFLYDANARALARSIDTNQWVSTVAFSPDGRILAASTGTDAEVGMVELWDVRSGEKRSTFQQTGYSNALAFSPDGRSLAIASGPMGVQLWDVTASQMRFTLPVSDTIDALPAQSVAFSPDGRILATDSGGDILLFDTVTGKTAHTLNQGADVQQLVFSPDGQRLAAADREGLQLWNLNGSDPLWAAEGSGGGLTFSMDGQQLFAGEAAWDVATGQLIRTLIPNSSANHIGYRPDGQMAATADLTVVSQWDMLTGENLGVLLDTQALGTTIAFSPDNRLVATHNINNQIVLIDTATGAKRISFVGPPGSITKIAFSTDGELLAASGGNAVWVWDVNSSERLYILEGHTDLITDLAISGDNRRLASGSYDTTVRIYDLASGQHINTLVGHEAEVNTVAFSPDGRFLASGGNRYGAAGGQDAFTIRFWDVQTGEIQRAFGDELIEVQALAFHPQEPILAVGFSDTNPGWQIGLWDTEAGQRRQLLADDAGSTVAFSPDGRLLVAGSTRGLWMWDVATDQRLNQLAMGNIVKVAFSPDGNWLALSSNDGAIRLLGLDAR